MSSAEGMAASVSEEAEKPMDMAQGVATDAKEGMLDELLAKNAEARGVEKLPSIQSLKWNGDAQMMGMDMPITLFMKRPGKIRTEVEIKAMNMEFVSGFNGTEGWAINPAAGATPQALPKDQLAGMKDQADIDGVLVNYKEKGHVLEYLGEEVVKGKPAHKIKVVRADRPDVYLYLDAVSNLEVKTEGEGNNPQTGAKVKVETFMSDYREVGGVMLPHAMEIKMDGETFQTVVFSSIELNTEMKNDMFNMPGVSINSSTN